MENPPRSYGWSKDLYLRLVYLTNVHLKKKIWLGVRDGPLPGGLTHDDIIRRARVKFEAGIIAWDSRKTFLANYSDAIRRDINNIANSAENRMTIRAGEAEKDLPDRTVNVEADFIREDYVDKLLHFLSDDTECQNMAHLILRHDVKYPVEFVKRLAMSHRQIDAAKKRLARKLDKFNSIHPNSPFTRRSDRESSAGKAEQVKGAEDDS